MIAPLAQLSGQSRTGLRFKVRAQDALVMQPAQGISLVAVEEAALVAAVFELRSARL